MRLIDADAIQYTMQYRENWMENASVTMQCAWKDEIDRLPTVEEQRWIPVNKELPVGGLMVLVTCCSKKGQRSVNRAYYMDGCWHGSGSMAGVTAWMPLPEPYKEDKE